MISFARGELRVDVGAGVAALAIGNPAAALPGVLGFVSEAILVAILAFRAIHQKKTSRESGLHNI